MLKDVADMTKWTMERSKTILTTYHNLWEKKNRWCQLGKEEPAGQWCQLNGAQTSNSDSF